ncbi:hypothetical protein GQ55_3G082100 [Panicum hallii var. hallii]|uniref:Uncharacterized protein n=1 Tax=Panicum hallii var. hallii TaxID=1504633 RepID=A0A2T7E709_9POAL|nr:hypothetical protein GQ55_3G082100 [Panicum hallii var. hallii]
MPVHLPSPPHSAAANRQRRRPPPLPALRPSHPVRCLLRPRLSPPPLAPPWPPRRRPPAHLLQLLHSHLPPPLPLLLPLRRIRFGASHSPSSLPLRRPPPALLPPLLNPFSLRCRLHTPQPPRGSTSHLRSPSTLSSSAVASSSRRPTQPTHSSTSTPAASLPPATCSTKCGSGASRLATEGGIDDGLCWHRVWH